MTRGDFLVALCSLGALPWIYRLNWGGDEPGSAALIRSAAAEPRRLSLSHAGRYTVDGPQGETVIEIEGGRARIVASPCTNQHCVRAGWVSRSGHAVTCVPNRVSLRIEGGEPEYDSIHY